MSKMPPNLKTDNFTCSCYIEEGKGFVAVNTYNHRWLTTHELRILSQWCSAAADWLEHMEKQQ